jgi:hypothetical protein
VTAVCVGPHAGFTTSAERSLNESQKVREYTNDSSQAASSEVLPAIQLDLRLGQSFLKGRHL